MVKQNMPQGGKKKLKIKNMHCASCASMIELELEDVGVIGKCSYSKQTLEVDENVDSEIIKKAVEAAGYELA